MTRSIYLAVRYILYHRWKTLVLVGCITLTAFLPILLAFLLQEIDRRMVQRSEATPIVIGAKGSGVELTLHALYFSKAIGDTVPYGEVAAVRETGLAEAMPLYSHHTAMKFPVVGTTIDYLEFRSMRLESGRTFAMIGECVIGSEVAKKTGLHVGEKLLTDRENLVDIAGLYPLKLQIVGVLKPTGTADDRGVFVDLKTSWVLDGLGHGHEDLAEVNDEGKILSRDDENIVALASVLPYIEITSENVASVHFHGDRNTFPISAVIVVPKDEKSKTLLIGRYQNSPTLQVLEPRRVIADLMGLVFQVSQVFQASMGLVAVSTLLLLALVVALSLRLRAGEMQTMFRMGCSRSTIFQLQLAELLLVFLLSAGCLAVLVLASYSFGGQLLERLIVG